jgi:hypothetical protein
MSRSNRIQIFCDGGLGNRLNTLLSGLAIAKLFELQATVYWPRNNWCKAAFGDIFSTRLDISEQSLSDVSGTLDEAIVLLHDQLGADTLRVPFHSAYSYTSTDDFSKQVLPAGKDIFYYPALIPPWLPLDRVVGAIQACPFHAWIRQAVIEFVSNTIGRPFYGLHLRRTDLNVGFADSEVQDILCQHPNEVFFVCSDDPIAERLAAAHPNVRKREKREYVGKRNSHFEWTTLTTDDDGRLYNSNIDRNAESVVDAAIDMLILAHSCIVGFSGSTFQNMARLYGTHAPLVDLAKPRQEITYFSLKSATRMIRSGTMSLGEALNHGASLYAAGRKKDAIALEKISIDYGASQGARDINFFALHYNHAAHLINEGMPYEAGLYLERALIIYPDHEATLNMLILAKQRSGIC